MQIYTETLTDNLDVRLPQDLIALLDIEPGDTVVFQVRGNYAAISGLELASIEPEAQKETVFSEWGSRADEGAYRSL